MNTDHARIQKVFSEGVHLSFFLVNEWIQIPTTRIGPSSARHADDDPTLNAGLIFQGILTSIAKKPYNFVIFHGGWGLDALSPPPLWIPIC